MSTNETIAIIKDCIFESAMMGKEIRQTLRDLHVVDGFEKCDIIQAYNEMVEEAKGDEE